MSNIVPLDNTKLYDVPYLVWEFSLAPVEHLGIGYRNGGRTIKDFLSDEYGFSSFIDVVWGYTNRMDNLSLVTVSVPHSHVLVGIPKIIKEKVQ